MQFNLLNIGSLLAKFWCDREGRKLIFKSIERKQSPWQRVCQELIVAKLVKKMLCFFQIQIFFTIFINSYPLLELFPNWLLQFALSNDISMMYGLNIAFDLFLQFIIWSPLPNNLFPSPLPTKYSSNSLQMSCLYSPTWFYHPWQIIFGCRKFSFSLPMYFFYVQINSLKFI